MIVVGDTIVEDASSIKDPEGVSGVLLFYL